MAKYRKLGRTSSQRKALIRSQVTALLHNGRIITTEARAKEVRKVAEGLIQRICLQKKKQHAEIRFKRKIQQRKNHMEWNYRRNRKCQDIQKNR